MNQSYQLPRLFHFRITLGIQYLPYSRDHCDSLEWGIGSHLQWLYNSCNDHGDHELPYHRVVGFHRTQ